MSTFGALKELIEAGKVTPVIERLDAGRAPIVDAKRGWELPSRQQLTKYARRLTSGDERRSS